MMRAERMKENAWKEIGEPSNTHYHRYWQKVLKSQYFMLGTVKAKHKTPPTDYIIPCRGGILKMK